MRGVVAAVVVAAAVALAVVLAGSGAFNSPTPSPMASPSVGPTASQSNGPPPSFPTARPSATPTDNSVVASGVVVPLRSADLATRVSGVVAAIYVHESSEVAANQLLLKLDQSTYQNEINVADEEVGRATAAVELAQLQVEQLPPDASPGEIETAQANLRLAQAELELNRAKLSEAQTALLQTEVRAPFAGTIAEVDVETGEQALAGETVMTIGDISGWLIETTDLSELEVVRLAVGDRATVTFDALPDLTIDGTVDRIQVRGASDDGGVVFAVAIRPDDHNGELRWGMSATVHITPSG
jgi:HlyD family secretion protein